MLIDICSLKDTILMPPPMLPNKFHPSQSISSSEDFQRHLSNEHLIPLSTENTIITSLSHYSLFNHHFLQRKRSSFQEAAITECSDEDIVKTEGQIDKRFLNKNKFKKLPIPGTNKQIDTFVLNMLNYLSNYNTNNNSAIILKTKISIRYEDYQCNGLNKDYFLIALSSMQNELIALICQEDNSLVIG